MVKKIGKAESKSIDLQIRSIVEARTKQQVKLAIIDWINNRAANSILPNQTIPNSEAISKYIISYQYKSIEFLLSHLDKLYDADEYSRVTSMSVTYLYRTTTFDTIINMYTSRIMSKYDEHC